MSSKRRSIQNNPRKIPLPVILGNASEIADNYDNYLQMLCKEYPSTMMNFETEKKIILRKKADLQSLIDKTREDIQNMNCAVIQLNSLFLKEKEFEKAKEKEIENLRKLVSEANDRKRALKLITLNYSSAQNFVDDLAKANKFSNVISLVRYYLIIETMNSGFIDDQLKEVRKMKKIGDIRSESRELFEIHQDRVATRSEKVDALRKEIQEVRLQNRTSEQFLDHVDTSRLEEHGTSEFMKRWTWDTCKKISVYKDISSQAKDMSRQLDEVYDFIIAAKKILKH